MVALISTDGNAAIVSTLATSVCIVRGRQCMIANRTSAILRAGSISLWGAGGGGGGSVSIWLKLPGSGGAISYKPSILKTALAVTAAS